MRNLKEFLRRRPFSGPYPDTGRQRKTVKARWKMNRWTAPVVLTILAVVTCLALLCAAAPSGASEFQSTAVAGTFGPPPGAAVFEMKYRGLDKPDDPLSYHSF